jgi:hypothetical protein
MSIRNPYKGRRLSPAKDYFNEGVKAVLQYLEEPCSEHPMLYRYESFNLEQNKWNNHEKVRAYPDHRYLCPDCMRQIKEELGI